MALKNPIGGVVNEGIYITFTISCWIKISSINIPYANFVKPPRKSAILVELNCFTNLILKMCDSDAELLPFFVELKTFRPQFVTVWKGD